MTPNWVCIPCFWERRISRHLSFTGLLIVPSTKKIFLTFSFFLFTSPSHNHFFCFLKALTPQTPLLPPLFGPSWTSRWTSPLPFGPSWTSPLDSVAEPPPSAHLSGLPSLPPLCQFSTSLGRLDPNYIGPLPTRKPLFIGKYFSVFE